MAKIDFAKLPKFSELPVKKGAPPDSYWGVFGDDDEVGCLNFLTPEGVIEAARMVQNGKVFRLDTRINYANPPLFERKPAKHTKTSFESPTACSASTTCSTTTTPRKAASGTASATSAICALRPSTTA